MPAIPITELIVNKKARSKTVYLHGHDLIREPLLNKGGAFSAEERAAFGLEGLLPVRTVNIEMQVQRMYRNLQNYGDPLQKFVYLASLQDRNEHLYFRLLSEYLEELLPIIYTPTVGLVTRKYSHIFQRGRGIWISPDMRGRIAPALKTAARGRDVRLIVATDNESILGIGDQGAGGMAIAIGKLALYTAGAGIDPATVLPVSLDVGTENAALLSDERYLGWPERRLRGAEYQSLLDEFVTAVRSCFPGALVQWEDFRKDNALTVLDRYVDQLPSFNDDIQGTGAVALAGILSAERIHGRRLVDERVLILGAGAAGLGITRQIRAALCAEGISADRVRHQIAVLDSRGLLVNDGGIRDAYKQEMAWDPAFAKNLGLTAQHELQSVVNKFRPTVLIGTSGQPGAFHEHIVRATSNVVDRPLIMPLSNPTDQSEAVPAEVLDWSAGQALIATGSPFPDVIRGERRVRVGQGNNAFIFPGVGLGALLAGTSRVTDDLFYAAAKALAGMVSEHELNSGLLYPPISRLREVSTAVASAVMRAAVEEGLCPALKEADMQKRLSAGVWTPEYQDYVPAERSMD